MDKTARNVRIIYGAFLSLFTVAVGILFIVECALIYDAGTVGNYFSPAIVSAHFKKIAIPVFLWVAAAIAGYVLSVVFPYAKQSVKFTDLRKSEKRLLKRVPKGEGEEFTSCFSRYKKRYAIRVALWGISAIFAVISAIVAAVYLFNTSHFPASDITGEVVAMLRSVFPYIGVSFVLFIGVTLYEHFTAKRDLALVKQLIVAGKGMPVAPAEENVRLKNFVGAITSRRAVWIIRGLVLALAITFIILGVVNGGMHDVFEKAVKICTECIGLG